MSGSVVAPLASSAGVDSPEPGGAGSLKWQRARLVLDQHQRGVEVGPVGRVLPVRSELADLLPYRGLRRGSTVVVRGSTTVLLALLAEATADGSWAAVVGMPDLGLLAAAELGVALSRLALVPDPGAELGAVVAALLDGLDLVVTVGMPVSLARRLSARARHRESVLLTDSAWPGADLELDCAEGHWTGLGRGHGHLESRTLRITTIGRGSATRPIHTSLTLPAPLPTPLFSPHHPRLPQTRDTTPEPTRTREITPAASDAAHQPEPTSPPRPVERLGLASVAAPVGDAVPRSRPEPVAAPDSHSIVPAAQTSAPTPTDEPADAARPAGRRPGLASVPELADEPSARPRPAPAPVDRPVAAGGSVAGRSSGPVSGSGRVSAGVAQRRPVDPTGPRPAPHVGQVPPHWNRSRARKLAHPDVVEVS